MSQNDFTLANQSFPAFRADLNSALQALASNNSGGSAPSTTFANMWWYDSSNNIMYIRNEDNDAWIKFAELDQANDKFVLSGTLQLDDGTVSAPALTFNSDTNMGIYRGGTDILKFVTAGTDAITINASQQTTFAGNIDVTGTVTADGLTTIGATVEASPLRLQSNDTSVNLGESIGDIEFYSNDSSGGGSGIQAKISAVADNSFGTSYALNFLTGASANPLQRMQIANNGDISFYEDTGTTPKMVWSASTERLGIGTASPTHDLQIQSTSPTVTILSNVDNTSRFNLLETLGGSGDLGGFIQYEGTTNNVLELGTVLNGTDTTHIYLPRDGSGNVGIGVTPSSWSSFNALEMSNGVHLGSFTGGTTAGYLGTNNYFNGSNFIYKNSDFATRYQQVSGNHQWFNSTSGTAGNTVSFTQAMTLDASGNLLVGTTDTNVLANRGFAAKPQGSNNVRVDIGNNYQAMLLSTQNDGSIVDFYKDATGVGSIASIANDLVIFSTAGNHKGLRFGNEQIIPVNNAGAISNDTTDLGGDGARFDDIFATNGTINTSDRNEKQDIAELNEAETAVAIACKSLLRKFRWKKAVAEKGDNARTHFGIIAQDLQDAFTAEGLDASDYGMFTSGTWWEKEISVDAVEADEENGIEAKDAYTYMDIKDEATEGYTEKTRLGVRYNQLLAFIISAI